MKTVIKVIVRTAIILAAAGIVTAATVALAPSLVSAGGRGRFEGNFEGRRPPTGAAAEFGDADEAGQLPNFGEGRGEGRGAGRGERGGRDSFSLSARAVQPLLKNFGIMAAITLPFAAWAVVSKKRRRAQHAPKAALERAAGETNR